MVYGVNVSGKLANAPKGELDTWIRADKLAELTGQPEGAIRNRLSETFQPFSAGRMDFVIRLKNLREAEGLIQELKALSAERAKSPGENIVGLTDELS